MTWYNALALGFVITGTVLTFVQAIEWMSSMRKLKAAAGWTTMSLLLSFIFWFISNLISGGFE